MRSSSTSGPDGCPIAPPAHDRSARRDELVHADVQDGARRQVDLAALRADDGAAAAHQHADQRALLAVEDAAQDAAERGAGARALLAEAALVDAHHARPDVGAAAVRHRDLVERDLQPAAVRRAPGGLDVRDDAADGGAGRDDDAAVDTHALGDRGLDAVLTARGGRRQRLLEPHRELGAVGYRDRAGARGAGAVDRAVDLVAQLHRRLTHVLDLGLRRAEAFTVVLPVPADLRA